MPPFHEAFFGGHHTDLRADGTRLIDADGRTVGQALLPPAYCADLDLFAEARESALADARLWASASHLVAMCRLLALAVVRHNRLNGMTEAQIWKLVDSAIDDDGERFKGSHLWAADVVFTHLLSRAKDVEVFLRGLPAPRPSPAEGGAR